MITRTRALAVLVALAAFCLGLYVLRHDDTHLAILNSQRGAHVERDHRAAEGAFSAAANGDRFYEGDSLRTGPSASALALTRSGASVTLGSNTTVRFTADPDGLHDALGLDVRMGMATIRAGAHATRLRTHVGLAVLDENSQIVVRRDAEALALEVTLGGLRFVDALGRSHVLDKDTKVRVGIGMALMESTKRAELSAEFDGGVSTQPANEPLREPQNRSEDGKLNVVDSLPFAHLRVRAGESFVVHAPGAPLAIGFSLPRTCVGPVELDIGNKRRVRGESGVSAAFGPGTVAYQVRCHHSVVSRGRVTLLLDAGTRKLPSRAPVTDIDADGRAYSIYYQNQLPEVRVRWPGAPSVGPYTVEVDGQARTLDEPTFLFGSGSLSDGAHAIVWSAGKRRSRPAHVRIQYDSAAPTASVSAPEDRGFAVGDTVRIRGEALRAWKVELDNGTIDRDAHDRFSGARVTTRATPDIAVRLSHPRHGVHYYVRRSVESP